MNDRIKKVRRALDLTQQEFAARIGSVQNTITGYETGRRVPSNQVISLICKEFHVNEEWLRTGKGEMFAPKATDALEALAKERHLSVGVYVAIEKFLNLKPETQQSIVDLFSEVAAAINGMDVDPRSPAFATAALVEAEAQADREELHAELDRQLDLEEKPEATSEVS